MTHLLLLLRNAIRGALLCVAVLLPGWAAAHHSFAVFFDGQKSISITGVVKERSSAEPQALQVEMVDGTGIEPVTPAV